MSNFLNEVSNDRFVPEFNVSILKETIALVQDYVSETRKWKTKLAGKKNVKTKYEIFLQWNTKFFLQKGMGVLHFGSWRNCMSSANLVAETH